MEYGYVKVRIKATGQVIEVTPYFHYTGSFEGYQDKYTHIWPGSEIEPITKEDA